MKRIRAKFIKGEQVKFLSHLDILRTFDRALRRSNIPVAYSKGFNPHPLISFALPLSVGVTSEGELVDIDIEGNISVNTFVKTLNMGLPEGLKVISAQEVDLKSNIMAIVKAAKYKVSAYGDNLEDIEQKIISLISQDSIIVKKESKKEKREIDIKNGIRSISVLKKDNNFMELLMELNAGSQLNVKPEMVIEALEKYYDIKITDINIHRLELLS